MRGQLDSLGNLKSGELENSIGQQLARMKYLKLSQSKLLTSQLEDPEVEVLNYYSMEADLDQTYAIQTNVTTDSEKSVDEDDYAFWLQMIEHEMLSLCFCLIPSWKCNKIFDKPTNKNSTEHFSFPVSS